MHLRCQVLRRDAPIANAAVLAWATFPARDTLKVLLTASIQDLEEALLLDGAIKKF